MVRECGRFTGRIVIVHMCMTREVTTVAPDEPLSAAAEIMARLKVRRLPVVQIIKDSPRLVGIVSASDVLHAFPPDVNPFGPSAARHASELPRVSSVMTKNVATTRADAPIEEAAQLMAQLKVGALPVLNGKRLTGIVTESDVFRALAGILGGAGTRITYDTSSGEDVVGTVAKAARRHGLKVGSVLTFRWQGRDLAVVRVTGDASRRFVDQIWKSGHSVLSIVADKKNRAA